MYVSGKLGVGPTWVRLAPNGTNQRLFYDQISVHFGSIVIGITRLVISDLMYDFSKQANNIFL